MSSIRSERLGKHKKLSQKGYKRYRKGKGGEAPARALVFFIPRWPSHMPEQAYGVQRGCNYPGENLIGVKAAFERTYGYACRLTNDEMYEALRDFHTEPRGFWTLVQRREKCLEYLKRYEFDLILTKAEAIGDTAQILP